MKEWAGRCGGCEGKFGVEEVPGKKS